MSASLTPLRRFAGHTSPPVAPRIITLGIADSLGDLQIPMPPTSCWADLEQRLEAQASRMDELGCATHQAMGLDAPAQPEADKIQAARTAAYADGLREGAERRTWWDVAVGLTWGVAVLALLLGALAAAGWVDVKVRVWGDDTFVTPAPAQQHPTTHRATQA